MLTRHRLLILLLLLFPCSLKAQTGAVTGTALDSVGNVVAGATITVCAQGSPGIPCSPVTASTTSNGQGAFSVTVPVGTYTVTVFRSGVVATSSTVVVAPSNITVGNNVTYNGSVTFTGNVTFNSQITSTVPTGTAPFVIASTTAVTNLNAQLHGGLSAPASAILGLTDTQSPTNKTIDISLNTLKTATNTAGHYPRNSGTQYVDATIAAADLPATTAPCTGVQLAIGLNAGGTSNCVTPPTFVASGASHAVGYVPDPGSSAGTTHFLREDATWATVPASGVSEMIFSWGAVAAPGGTASLCTVSGGVFSCPQILLPNAHTIIRFTYFLQTAPVGCSTNAVMGVWDFNTASALTTITVNQGSAGFVDSGVISVATTAGHKIGIGFTTLPAGCSTFPSILSLTAILQ